MLDEVLRGEAIESDLNKLIERRAQKASAANAEEDLWKASARRHAAKLREQRLWDRRDFYQAMIQSHTSNFERLIRRHTTGLSPYPETSIAGMVEAKKRSC